MKYQHGQPGWDGAKVNRLLDILEGYEEHDMTMPETIQELYNALRWIFNEYRVLRGMMSEVKTIVAPEQIPLIDEVSAK